MSFCLPKEFSKKFTEALKEGQIVPEKLAAMTSDERRGFFEKIVGADHAKDVNALFESKLLLKDYKTGLVSWAKKVADLSEPARREMVQRINNLDKILNPAEESAFLKDLAEQKLGVGVTVAEAKNIADLAKKAQELRDAPTTKLSGVSDEYLKAAGEMKAYIASLKPISALASIGKNAAIIARNNLLLNPSTPIKTTAGQVVNTGMDFFTRRLAEQSLGGLNADLARTASNEAWDTFRKTGLNTASMESIEDTGKLGEGKRFDVPSGMDSSNPVVRGIESTVRTVARISNKVAIDWEHNITFTKFYQKAFFDMSNIFSSSIAKDEGLSGTEAQARAAEILKDAAKIKPETDVGAAVRQESQRQAARVTSTNNTIISRMALEIKDGLNRTVTGLGDALMPIAKIPANIIWNGIENAGVGIPLGVKDIFQGRIKIQSEDLSTRYEGMAQYASGIQKVARTVGVISAAAFFASQLQKQDFRSDNYENHFVKIGNVWINMEYINAVSPALAGMMTVKMKGSSKDGVLETAGQYSSGALAGLKSAPGIDEVSQLVTAITNSNYTKGIQKYASDFFTSRGEPAFIQNLLKDRPIERLFFGATGVETQDEVNADNRAKAAKRGK